MTTQRRTRSARPFVIPPAAADPFDAVLTGERERTAEDLAEALDGLAGMSGSNVKVYVYKIKKQGPWENVKILEPPVKSEELIEFCRDEYGPGDYAARVYAGGTILTTKHFGIAQPKNALPAAGRGLLSGGDDGALLKLLLERSAPPDNSGMIAMMMKQADDSNQRFMTMMSTMIPLLVQRPDGNGADAMMKAAMFLKEVQGPQQTLKDSLETFAAIRDLTGGGGEGGFMGLVEKIAPALASITEMSVRNQAVAAGGEAGQVAPVVGAAPGISLPPPRPLPPAVPNADGSTPPPAANDPPGTTHPVLEIVKADIAYFMHRGHDPELAAEAVADILEANAITEEQVRGLGMEIFTAGPAWPTALAGYGLNVSTQPGHADWFMAFVQSLAGLYDGDAGADEEQPEPADHSPARHRIRPGRSVANAGGDAPAGGDGEPQRDGEKPGGEADGKLSA